MSSLSLLQGIFPTQESNPGLPHCGQGFYQLATGEAKEYWSGYPIPYPEDLPDPGIQPGSPALQVDSLPAELCALAPDNTSDCIRLADDTQ